MTLGDEIGKLMTQPLATPAPVAVTSTPRGWEPRVEYDDAEGQGTTPPRPAAEIPPSHAEILKEFGLDPEAWQVLTLRKSRWQSNSADGPIWLEAYRATFKALSPNDPGIVKVDVDELAAEIRGFAPGPVVPPAGDGPRAAFVLALSDYQLGKGEGGGSKLIAARILESYNSAVIRLANLRSLGYQIDTVALLGLGDLVEGCSGFYAMQEFQTDLDSREQRKIAWRLVLRAIQMFSPLAQQVRVTGISGNHSENRNGAGKAYTTFEDSDDLLLLDALSDIVGNCAGLSNVSIELPEDALAHTIELEGTPVGMVHGHQFKGGKGGERSKDWWSGQMFGVQPIKDAKILLNGHFHSLQIGDYSESGRTTIQAPAMDNGSRWFTSGSGLSSAPGMLTMLVGQELGAREWDELKIV